MLWRDLTVCLFFFCNRLPPSDRTFILSLGVQKAKECKRFRRSSPLPLRLHLSSEKHKTKNTTRRSGSQPFLLGPPSTPPDPPRRLERVLTSCAESCRRRSRRSFEATASTPLMVHLSHIQSRRLPASLWQTKGLWSCVASDTRCPRYCKIIIKGVCVCVCSRQTNHAGEAVGLTGWHLHTTYVENIQIALIYFWSGRIGS